MNTTYDALIVPAQLTRPVRMERVDIDVDVLQELVGEGDVRSPLRQQDWHVYLNDEGSRLPQNDRAEVLMREAGTNVDDALYGTAVFLGHGTQSVRKQTPLAPHPACRKAVRLKAQEPSSRPVRHAMDAAVWRLPALLRRKAPTSAGRSDPRDGPPRTRHS